MDTKTLSKISLKIASGLTPLRGNSEFWSNATIPWLKTEQLGNKYIYDTNEYISSIAVSKIGIQMFPENTLSIAMYGEGRTRGNLSILKKAMTTNQACCNVVIDPNKADFEYVYYYLKTQYEVLRNLSSGVRKNLNSNDIKNFQIRLPKTKTEQICIAAVLKVLDDKIELNNRINAELEAMAKTLYDYWFVQFDFPDENGKPYKSSGGKMVYDETLKREIPEGWKVKPLVEWIENTKTGDWGKENAENNYNTLVECIRGTDINGLNGTESITPPQRYILKKNRDKFLLPYDLIVEISGGSPTQSTGRLALLTKETLLRFQNPLICSNFCKAISLKDYFYSYNFLYLWYKIYNIGLLFGWEGKTSGIKNLLFDPFAESYHTCYPPKELVGKFFSFAESIHKQRQNFLKESSELEKLKEWLLPMLMNGQVTVK